MRLDFNVLWVDDQPGAVGSQTIAIAKGMEDEGFEFKPTMCRSIEEVRNRIAENVFNDEVDLILVDWDLGAAVQGQQVISEIRDSIRYKDVVFYSAMTGADALRKLAFDNHVEGIYCAARGDLVEEVLGVFESLVKKVLDLDHTRGIVMGSTSDIDQMVLECVDAAHGKLGGPAQGAMVKDALKIIEERVQKHANELKKLQGAPNMAALLKAHMLFTANDRLRILSRALEMETFQAHSAVRASVVKYIGEVVPTRNSLGHKVLSPEGKATGIAVVGGQPMNIDQMRELRKLILNLRGEFRGLRDALRG